MTFRLHIHKRIWLMVCGVAFLVLPATPTMAQLRPLGRCQPGCDPAPCIVPETIIPSQPAPGVTPEQPAPQPGQPQPSPGTETPFGSEQASAVGGSGFAMAESPGGYLDDAIPRTMFRVRFDQGFDMNRPDRAELFYAAWRELSFHPHGIINQSGTFQTSQGKGLDPLPGELDYDEFSGYFELAANNVVSAFVEVPFRAINLHDLFHDTVEDPEPPFPDPHESLERFLTNSGGFGDMIAGFKVAVLSDPCRFLTFQFRTFFPTGDARRGLGTGHYSVEPGLLYYQRLSDRLSVQGQFKGWIPLDGTKSTDGQDFAGSILIYGLGFGYDVVHRPNLRVTPVVEFVGWTVLDGFQTVFDPNGFNLSGGVPEDHAVENVGGMTIVNGKIGVRTYIGERHDLYVGWGHALTEDRWYKDIIRLEYRMKF